MSGNSPLAKMRLPHFVYILRNFEGQAVYIGKTINVKERLAHHRRCKVWWPEVASQEIIEYADLFSASCTLSGEAFHIRNELPLYNIDYNPRNERRLSDYNLGQIAESKRRKYAMKNPLSIKRANYKRTAA